MGIKVRGMAGTRVRLENERTIVPKAGFQAMKEGGEKIADLATAYTYVKRGYLEDAIRVLSARQSEGIVTVGISPKVSGHGQSRPVIYGTRLHEGYGNIGLGPASQAKDAGSGKVGPGFLTRAAKELRVEIQTDVLKAVARARTALRRGL